MQPRPSIALVCEGDAENPDASFSGISKSIVDGLRDLAHPVTTVDVDLYGAARLFLAGLTFDPKRTRWRARFRLGGAAHLMRTIRGRQVRRTLADPHPEAVLQIGATFFQPFANGETPYFLYCDSNLSVARRFRALGVSPGMHLTERAAQRANEREAHIYRNASGIFTICEHLRESFLQDYGVPADRVHTVFAGANFDADDLPPAAVSREGTPPTVLFVGKAFERKGGDVLLRAFARVRERMPDARLVVIGPDRPAVVPPGVEFLGSLRKSVHAERDQLLRAYASASVFCLPTRYEPFGVAVIEAMMWSLPCVTSDVWAMTEIVEDGVTGFTVPAGDDERTADALLAVLGDPERARAMGRAGRARALDRFTWERTVRTMSTVISRVAAGRGAARFG